MALSAPKFACPNSYRANKDVPKSNASSSGFRYRRSPTTKAPRKRTFIANMQKLVIDLATPPGLTGAYVSQGSVCQNTTLSNAPCCCGFCQPISTSGGAGDAFENSIVGCDGGNGGDSCGKSHSPGGDNGDDYSTGRSGISFAIALLGAAIMFGTLCFPITLQDLLADTFNVSPTASAALSNTLPMSFTIEEAAHPLPDVLLQQDNPMDWETSLRTSVELVGHGMSMPRRMVNIISVVGGVLDGVRI